MAKSPAVKKRTEDLMDLGMRRSQALKHALHEEKLDKLTKGGKLRGQKQSKSAEDKQEDK